MYIRKIFFVLTAIIYFFSNAAIAIYVINWTIPTSVAMYLILSFFLVSFSFLLSKRLLAFFLKPYKLPKLDFLGKKPKVAILYTTMNDVVEECLRGINQSYDSDVFVLDDSTDPNKRSLVGRVANELGYVVLRRSERKGFKAGAMNNWFAKYGKNYDYVVVLDADSLLPSYWVEEALKYAEHPENRNIAIFQGLINIWNKDNKFVKVLAPLHKVGQDIWEKKLANYLDAVYCYGHNVMIKVRALEEIGGFVSGYVSEDFATAVKLAERGYKCRFVPLNTYEAIPENVRGFVKRQNKWTKGSMEFFDFIKNSKISLSQKTILSLIPLGHISYILILAAMFLTVYGYSSSFSSFVLFIRYLIHYHLFFIWSIPLFRYMIFLHLINTGLLLATIVKLKIGLGNYFKHQILSKSIGAVMLPYEIKSIFSYLLKRKRSFPVTPKDEPRLSVKEILSIAKISIFISIVLSIGLYFINPLGLLFNALWFIPFFFSPFVLLFYSGPSSEERMPSNYGLSAYMDFGQV